MVSPTTSPQAKFAPRCEQRASSTATLPLAVRNATRSRPRIPRPKGPFSKSFVAQKKYQPAGWTGNAETGGTLAASSFLLGLARLACTIIEFPGSLCTLDQEMARNVERPFFTPGNLPFRNRAIHSRHER